MGLPATSSPGDLRGLHHHRARWTDHRLGHPRLAGARDEPPADLLHPADAFVDGALRPTQGASWCEWKGEAAYFDLVTPEVAAHRAAWTYPHPTPGFTDLAGAIAVMPALVDRATVDGETVVPQPGNFYGGWVTSKVVGPFKGIPGSMGW